MKVERFFGTTLCVLLIVLFANSCSSSSTPSSPSTLSPPQTPISNVSPTNSPKPVEETNMDEWKVKANAYLKEMFSFIDQTNNLLDIINEAISNPTRFTTIEAKSACDDLGWIVSDVKHLSNGNPNVYFDFIKDQPIHAKYINLDRRLSDAYFPLDAARFNIREWAENVEAIKAAEYLKDGLQGIAEFHHRFEFLELYMKSYNEWP